MLTASGFVVFVLWLALGRFGSIPLGCDDEEPEFRTISWVAMMFSAGMGIGLMFFGVAEPLTHFATPPPGTGPAGNPEAVQTAMATTLFHWTLHPWAIYAVVGLAIAYGVYRKGRMQSISSAFEPLLGSRANGPGGKVIDMLAIFATLFGSAASLGLGALQIRSGLHIVAGISETGNTVLVVIITVLTVAFVLSAVSGVARGIQWLSNINMVLAILLAAFVFVFGPTVFILNLLPTSLGSYFSDIAMMSARTGAEGADVDTWLQSWTIFYWADRDLRERARDGAGGHLLRVRRRRRVDRDGLAVRTRHDQAQQGNGHLLGYRDGAPSRRSCCLSAGRMPSPVCRPSPSSPRFHSCS